MKKLVFIIAVVLFLKPILPVLEYIVNYDYIAKELCENKEKPELECNGKCHLKKELAKASDSEASKEKPISNDKKNNPKQEIEVLYCQIINELLPRQIYFHNKTLFGDQYANLYFHTAYYSIFHPPIV